MQRILAFLDPWKDARGSGYQLIQSLIAIGSGGIAGQGLGAGLQKEAFLPGATNDFVFSVVAEELGLIGSVVLIGLFAWLLWESLRVVLRSPDPFGFALGLGLAVLLGTQAATHIAVATACVPTKGLSLPFISAGGSSLIASMFAAGLLVGIARFRGQPEPWQEEVPAYERLANRMFGRLRRACGNTVGPHLHGTEDD
jgi:cell division protein FtsW